MKCTILPEVITITPPRYKDDRGFFSESWNRKSFAQQVGDIDFVQDNHSMSVAVNTVRGLHYQSPPFAQDKLVRVSRGRILDVAVDFRLGSPRYGQWTGVELSARNGKQLFIPQGFLHGFVTLEPDTEVLYKCSAYYAPECDGSVRFDDPEIAIDWGGILSVTTSQKDAAAPFLKDVQSPFTYGEIP